MCPCALAVTADGLHDTDFKNDLKRDMTLTGSRYGMGVCPTCCNPCMDTVRSKGRRTIGFQSPFHDAERGRGCRS